jgi:Uma2 family endonuclease
MAFLVEDAHLPAILTVGPMTDEAFAHLCAEHPDLSLELSALGELTIIPPTYTWTGARNNQISAQLRIGPVRTSEASPSTLPPDGCYPTPPGVHPTLPGSLNTASKTWTRPPSAATGQYVPTS